MDINIHKLSTVCCFPAIKVNSIAEKVYSIAGKNEPCAAFTAGVHKSCWCAQELEVNFRDCEEPKLFSPPAEQGPPGVPFLVFALAILAAVANAFCDFITIGSRVGISGE